MPTPSRREKIEPYWQSDCGRAVIYLGDSMHVMMHLDRDQFHAIVTDPPYGLEFMGKEWDAPWKQEGGVDAPQRGADELSDPIKAKYLRHNVEYNRDTKLYQQWYYDRATQMLRVAKPGAHLLSFGGTRMWHREACAIEDAGFDIRDTVMWVYGSGFPKSHDVSKAIDRHLGAEREVVDGTTDRRGDGTVYGIGHSGNLTSSEPITDEARQWAGFGTALKPAVEPIILARKPFAGSVAECVLENGCGGLNVDGCRVGTTGADVTRQIQSKNSSGSGVYQFNSGEAGSQSMRGGFTVTHKDGRWPANLIHDGSAEVVELFPTTGPSKASGYDRRDSNNDNPTHVIHNIKSGVHYADPGGSAARFFYTAKADEDDRAVTGTTVHPTVKPLDLMRYLVRLVAAPGSLVLDPFCGTASTGCACIAEGCWFVGIEQSKEYADLAVDRLKEMLGTHPAVRRLESGKRVVRDTPPSPRRVR